MPASAEAEEHQRGVWAVQACGRRMVREHFTGRREGQGARAFSRGSALRIVIVRIMSSIPPDVGLAGRVMN
jgi:hypothetical protein